MNIFTKQKQTDRHNKQPYGYQGGWEWINQEFGINKYILLLFCLTIYKIEKQQGPLVQHNKLYTISYNNL